ncbi:GNAT family N-acetyltransferase [Brachybacterium tyrofermentans]|uniref:GNAT family N-acetyltransferase n=1 Tax=Brachybacterium tyrofermentans TaxID=47848 RepID=UPI003FD3BB38
MITIVRGDELGEPYRRAIAAVFTQGFAEDFSFFSKDPDVLADAFAPMLLLEHFHVACVDGEPAGLATLTNGDQEVFDPSAATLRRHLGPIRGTICYRVIRSWFMGPSDGVSHGATEIGSVTTVPRFRGRGVGTALLQHLITLPGHSSFLLEDIKETNGAALGLYRKLGFSEDRRTPQRFPRLAGFTSLISMRLDLE